VHGPLEGIPGLSDPEAVGLPLRHHGRDVPEDKAEVIHHGANLGTGWLCLLDGEVNAREFDQFERAVFDQTATYLIDPECFLGFDIADAKMDLRERDACIVRRRELRRRGRERNQNQRKGQTLPFHATYYIKLALASKSD
jgi:hypothetical protein